MDMRIYGQSPTSPNLGGRDKPIERKRVESGRIKRPYYLRTFLGL